MVGQLRLNDRLCEIDDEALGQVRGSHFPSTVHIVAVGKGASNTASTQTHARKNPTARRAVPALRMVDVGINHECWCHAYVIVAGAVTMLGPGHDHTGAEADGAPTDTAVACKVHQGEARPRKNEQGVCDVKTAHKGRL